MSKSFTVGVLDCDHLIDELQARWGAQYSTMFERSFKAIDPSLQFRSWSAVDGQLPDDVHACDAWLVTGSKHDAYSEVPWVVALREWIVHAHAAKVKMVGICFGHQAIAKALGAVVGKSGRGWGAGYMPYELEARTAHMPESLQDLRILVSHQDQVHTLPDGATRLSGNDFCPNYAYQIGDHVLCIQGHPEFSKDYDLDILNARREKLGETVYRTACDSLTDALVNSDDVLRWILRFMQA